MDISRIYRAMKRIPYGTQAFSKLICFKAPYFGTISPHITHLHANQVVIEFKKRRRVLNHIKTVHAIACCNAAELAAGMLMMAGLPRHLRWIPKHMEVSYLRLATTNLTATVILMDWNEVEPGDLKVNVDVVDEEGVSVVDVVITMWISEKWNS